MRETPGYEPLTEAEIASIHLQERTISYVLHLINKALENSPISTFGGTCNGNPGEAHVLMTADQSQVDQVVSSLSLPQQVQFEGKTIRVCYIATNPAPTI